MLMFAQMDRADLFRCLCVQSKTIPTCVLYRSRRQRSHSQSPMSSRSPTPDDRGERSRSRRREGRKGDDRAKGRRKRYVKKQGLCTCCTCVHTRYTPCCMTTRQGCCMGHALHECTCIPRLQSSPVPPTTLAIGRVLRIFTPVHAAMWCACDVYVHVPRYTQCQ